jgi:hypothetical protein
MWSAFGALVIVAIICAVLKNSNGKGDVSRTLDPRHWEPLSCERCGGPLQDIGGYDHLGLTTCSQCASEDEKIEGEFTFGDYGH